MIPSAGACRPGASIAPRVSWADRSRCATSYLVKPRRKRATSADRIRQPRETKKDGLEDILRIVDATDEPMGGSQHHRTVACDQQFKRPAILGRHEATQQHGVFRRRGFIASPVKLSLQPLDRIGGHASILVETTRTSA